MPEASESRKGKRNDIPESVAHFMFIGFMSQRDSALLRCQKTIQSIDMVKSMAD